MSDQNDGSTQPISSNQPSNQPSDQPSDQPVDPPAADGPIWLSADAPSDPLPPADEPSAPSRGRTFRTRSVAAIAAGALLVGGGIGAALGVVASGDGHHDGPERAGFGVPTDGFGGQVPPGTAPDGYDHDDDDHDDDD